jgi:hypothetical protein
MSPLYGIVTAIATLTVLPVSGIAAEDGVADFFNQVLKNATYQSEAVVTGFREAPDDPEHKGIEDDLVEGWSHLSMDSNSFIGDYWSFGLGLDAIASTYHDGEQGMFTAPGQGDGQGRYVDLNRLTLSYLGDNAEILIGKDTIPMGVAEIYSPADLYGSSNLINPQQNVDFGVWQARTDIYVGSDRLTAIVMPLIESGPSASELSRWYAGGSSGSNFAALNLPALPGGMTAEAEDVGYNNDDPGNWGYLVEYKGTATGFDYFGSAYTGPSPYPVLKNPPSGQINPFRIEYPKVNIASLGATFTEGSWKFYGEGIGYWSPHGKDDDVARMMLGAKYRETTFANSIGLNEITPVVEFDKEWRLEEQSHPDYSTSSADARPNPENIIAALTVTINDEWKVGGAYNRSIRDRDSLTRLFVRYDPTDNLWMSVTAMGFHGSDGTVFGRFRRNDNVALKVHYSF